MACNSASLSAEYCCPADGATVRRYAFVDPAAAATIVSAPQLRSASALAGKDGPSSRSAELPDGLAAEVTYLQRRYGSTFRILDPAAGVSSRDDLAPPSERDRTPALCFALDLSPTDPSWEAGRSLPLRAWVSGAYPGPGSVRLAVDESSHLSRDVTGMLDRLLARACASTTNADQKVQISNTACSQYTTMPNGHATLGASVHSYCLCREVQSITS